MRTVPDVVSLVSPSHLKPSIGTVFLNIAGNRWDLIGR
jgi:hypothetical protein